MALGTVLGIPGLGGYLGMEQYRQQQALGNLQGQVGLMNAVRQQQQAEQEAQMAPLKMQAMQAQLQQAKMAAQDAQQKRDFFASSGQYMTPGSPGIEAPSAELGGGPGKPATAPRLDLERFVADGAAKGVFNPEALLSMQTRMQDRIAAREQRMDELRMRLEDQRTSAQEKMAFQAQLLRMQQEGRLDAIRFAAMMRPLRQEPQPQIVQTDNGPMQVDRAGNARPIVGPNGQPVTPKSTERALPTSAAGKLMENQQNLRRAEQALALVQGRDVGEAKGDANATGWKGFVPNTILNRVDPAGVDARAAIADLGSLVIHDRSGAAVTASEFPRLRPFIPAATDDAATAEKKLKRFVSEYQAVVDEAADFYKNSGYKVPTDALRPGVAPRTPAPSGLPSAADIDAELARRQRGTNGSF